MDAALGWLGEIVNALLQFVPRLVVVRQTHGGVKFAFGNHVTPMLCDNGLWLPLVGRTGLHIYLPLVTEIELVPIRRQPTNLSAQRLMTQDGVTVGVGGMIVYEIVDVVKLITGSWAYDATVRDYGMAAIKRVVGDNNFNTFFQQPDVIDTALTAQLAADLEPLGIRVLRVTLSDFATCFVHTNLA
jgi:regulator of protease activity HflC (stomatin/prohibitin superfamily)